MKVRKHLKRIHRKIIKRLSAFTLIEVLIVLAILILLALALFGVFTTQVEKARDARRKLDMGTITKALNDYYDSTGCYPASLDACGKPFVLNGVTLLSQIPCDPATQGSYVYVSDLSSCSKTYALYSQLERTDDQNIKLLGCANGCGPECVYNYGELSTNTGIGSCAAGTGSQSGGPLPPVGGSGVGSQAGGGSLAGSGDSGGSTDVTTDTTYACNPGGTCESYTNPIKSGCPITFINDSSCNNQCGDKSNLCKSDSGK